MGRREQILEAAYQIVGHCGLEGLHARTVAKELGIHHAAVHYYFRTRSDLISALIDYAFEKFKADHARLAGESSTPNERLDAMIALARDHSKRESPYFKNWASFYVASLDDDHLRDKLRQRLKEWLDVFDTSSLDASGSHPDKAKALAAGLTGVVVLSQALGPDFPTNGILERIARAFGS